MSKKQNVMMWILHTLAVLFGFVFLIVTIPMHFIIRNQASKTAK